MNHLIEVEKMSKKIGETSILDNISFSIREPGVLGLLGNNGAGKSTLMKVLTGLNNRTEGSVKVLGFDPWKDWRMIYKQVGVLFEPKIPKYLNNYEYLRQICILRGVERKKIDEVLELVNLKKSKKKVRDYSFGMTQRLGLAGVLLDEPQIIILDEPFIGLDPSGIEDLRQTIKRLANNGCLVFVSSHQLMEMEGLVDRILYLKKGILKVNSSIVELNKNKTIKIITTNNQQAFNILVAKGLQVTSFGETLEVLCDKNNALNYIISCFNDTGISLRHIDSNENYLKNLFN
ncbi:ABC transporter ATP-binding protein [Metabacillus sp. JX24]|uniref:ABC transporter ATP-binding protein n=1 Tax=Metabacillus sp. JX24 TaxID=3240759 RepID=UPI00350FA226